MTTRPYLLPSSESAVPGLPGVHVFPLPVAAPPVIPYEEALRRSAESRGVDGFVQGSLAIDWRGDAAPDDVVIDAPTRRHDLPAPEPVAARLATAMMEVMGGVRPAPQLVRWTTPEVYEVLARRAALASRRASRQGTAGTQRRLRVTTRRVLGCEPADGVAEMTVILAVGPRVRAVALRMVGHHGRWRVEAMQLG